MPLFAGSSKWVVVLSEAKNKQGPLIQNLTQDNVFHSFLLLLTCLSYDSVSKHCCFYVKSFYTARSNIRCFPVRPAQNRIKALQDKIMGQWPNLKPTPLYFFHITFISLLCTYTGFLFCLLLFYFILFLLLCVGGL